MPVPSKPCPYCGNLVSFSPEIVSSVRCPHCNKKIKADTGELIKADDSPPAEPKSPLPAEPDKVGDPIEMPTEQFQVDANDPPTIGSDKFDTLFTQFLSQEKLWRSAEAAAKALHCDKAKLDEWALQNPAVARRVGKDKDKKVYYGLLARLDEKKPDVKPATATETNVTAAATNPQSKKSETTPSITIQEMAALSMLHAICDSLIRTMDFYANRLATRHEEAFSHLTKAQKSLSSGVALLQKGLKVGDEKLPKLELL